MPTRRLPVGLLLTPQFISTRPVLHAVTVHCHALDRTKTPRLLPQKSPHAVNALPINRTFIDHETANVQAEGVGEVSPSACLRLAPDIDLAGDAPAAAVEHWDVLFSAVIARLSHASDVLGEPDSPHDDRVARMQVTVRECIEALEQLHATKLRAFVARK